MTIEKLTYDDLKLGEKAQELFYKGSSARDIMDNSAVYLNKREVIYGLNVTDLAIAGVLSGLPVLLIGKPGCGKSQLSSDFSRFYFNGTDAKGLAVEVDGTKKELDIYEEIFTQLNKEKLTRELSDKKDRCFFGLEEFNRQPNFTQNQFLNLAMGKITSPSGQSLKLGKNGYSMCVATANMGNGDYMGTFQDDKALRNRFGIVIDFNYEQFRPLLEDLVLINELREANPEVKMAPLGDISDKIIEANREISNSTLDLGLESKAVLYFLQFGLKNCKGDGTNVKKGTKEVSWPKHCQDCKTNSNNNVICSLVREVDGRTIQALPKYAAALDYLIRLKNPKVSVDATELMFKAFELTGAYQNFLNSSVLHQSYDGENPKMMARVVEELKQDYNKHKDEIISCFEASKQGLNHQDLFKSKYKGKTEIRKDYSEISKIISALKSQGYDISKIEFNDDGPLGYSWVNPTAEVIKKANARSKSSEDKKI